MGSMASLDPMMISVETLPNTGFKTSPFTKNVIRLGSVFKIMGITLKCTTKPHYALTAPPSNVFANIEKIHAIAPSYRTSLVDGIPPLDRLSGQEGLVDDQATGTIKKGSNDKQLQP
jgi:hypothetical protein